jgi:hypothetical protein
MWNLNLYHGIRLGFLPSLPPSAIVSPVTLSSHQGLPCLCPREVRPSLPRAAPPPLRFQQSPAFPPRRPPPGLSPSPARMGLPACSPPACSPCRLAPPPRRAREVNAQRVARQRERAGAGAAEGRAGSHLLGDGGPPR